MPGRDINVPIKRSVRSHSNSLGHRVATLCVLMVCLVAVTAFACAKDDAKAGQGSGAVTASAAPVSSGAVAASADTADTAQLRCDKLNDSATVWAAANHHRSDPLAVSQEEYNGWKTFAVYCFRCHGEDAMGTSIAPNLRHSLGPEGGVDRACFIHTVWNGRPSLGMPTWSVLLDSTQIYQLYAYITARSMGGLAPGRPHVGTVSK